MNDIGDDFVNIVFELYYFVVDCRQQHDVNTD